MAIRGTTKRRAALACSQRPITDQRLLKAIVLYKSIKQLAQTDLSLESSHNAETFTLMEDFNEPS